MVLKILTRTSLVPIGAGPGPVWNVNLHSFSVRTDDPKTTPWISTSTVVSLGSINNITRYQPGHHTIAYSLSYNPDPPRADHHTHNPCMWSQVPLGHLGSWPATISFLHHAILVICFYHFMDTLNFPGQTTSVSVLLTHAHLLAPKFAITIWSSSHRITQPSFGSSAYFEQ